MAVNDNNKRIAKNTAFLYIRMVFVLLVGLYTSRVVLTVLGVSDYGVYNVVAGFVSLFAFLNATLSSSLQRFYNYEEGEKGELGFYNVFFVGIRVHILLAFILLVLLETIGIWYINSIMVLPEGRLQAAHVLFQFSVLSLFIVVLEIPFSSAIIAKEKMDFYAVVSILDVIMRLVIVLLLPYIPRDKLIVYGFLQLMVTAVNFVLYLGYTKNKIVHLRFFGKADRSLLKKLLAFSGWNLFGTFVYMLKGQGVNLLLNVFFGTIVNAARGVAYQVNSALSGFTTNISMSFRPQMVSSYAVGNYSRSYNLFQTQSKICYCLNLMLIIPIIFEIDLILGLWLGESIPENTNIFTILVLLDALVCTLNTPVTQIVFATGNIKLYQIITSTVNVFLLPICWLLLSWGLEAWSVFVVTIIVSIVNQVASVYAMHKVFVFSMQAYLKQIILPCFLMTLMVPLLPYIIYCTMDDSVIRLLLITLTCVIVTLVLLYLLFLTDSEKDIAKSYIDKICKLKYKR